MSQEVEEEKKRREHARDALAIVEALEKLADEIADRGTETAHSIARELREIAGGITFWY